MCVGKYQWPIYFHPASLPLTDSPHLLARGELFQCDTTEKGVNLVAQLIPKMVSETNFAPLAIALAATAGSINAFIYGVDNFCDIDLARRTIEKIATPRTSHTGHQFVLTQLREQLFQVGKGYFLALGNITQTDGF